MDTESRGNILRAMRAYLNISQSAMADGAGVGRRTIWQAEAGESCSDRTWGELTGYYASLGLHLQEGDGVSIVALIGIGEVSTRTLVAQLRTQIDVLAARIDKD